MIPRRWLVLSVRSPSEEEAVGLLTEGLLASGGRAVQENAGRLVTHVPEPDDPDAFLGEVRTRLAGLLGADSVDLETGWQEDEDWAETWKRGLAPRRVTPRLVVTPSWGDPDARPGDVVVTLDPGMAFGNAEHGTTRGSLRLLDRVLSPGEQVLDVGTGSGILAIAAALLGAREVLALEGDPLACETARENVARNGVAGRVGVVEGWVESGSLARSGPFDGVLANLESSVITGLLRGLHASVRGGGWLVLSGILEGELDALLAHAARWELTPDAEDHDGEWRSVLLRRPS